MNRDHHKSGRRAILQNGTLLLATASISPSRLFAHESESLLKVGLITDLHYADKPPAGSRNYRETIGKLKKPQLNSNRTNRRSLSSLVT